MTHFVERLFTRVGSIFKMLEFAALENPICGGTSVGYIPNLRSLRSKLPDLQTIEISASQYFDLSDLKFGMKPTEVPSQIGFCEGQQTPTF